MEEVKLNVFQPTFPATSLPGQRLPANKLNHDQYRPRRRVFPIVFESHSTSRRFHSHCSPKLAKSGPSRRVRIADARRFSPSPQKTVILIFLPAATLDRRYLFLFSVLLPSLNSNRGQFLEIYIHSATEQRQWLPRFAQTAERSSV